MKEYRVELKIKNNLLYQKMIERGIETQAELSRLSGVAASEVGRIMALKDKPYRSDAGLQVEEIKINFRRLMNFFSCELEDIYPAEHFETPLQKNSVEIEFHANEILGIVDDASPQAALEHLEMNEKLAEALGSLTNRERCVLSRRHGTDDGHVSTLEEVAKDFGVTRDRIRQIEQKALRKLRNPNITANKELREALW